MRLEQLQYLLVTANCHSMHKASDVLHVSQQNISKSIRDLEKELSVLLFERTTAGLYLTSDGEKVYHLASEVCACTNKIERLFKPDNPRSQNQKLKGHLTVASIAGYSLYLFNAFQLFHQSCPKVGFHLEEREQLDVITYMLRHGGEWGLTTIDNDFTFITDPAFWQTYDVLILRQDYLKVLTTVSSPLVQFQSISDKQLRQQPLIIYTSSATQAPLVQLLLERENLKPSCLFTTNSQTVFSEVLVQKNAIALSSDLIFKSAVRKNADSALLLPMTHKIPLIHIIIKKKQLSPAGEIFHGYIIEALLQYGLKPVPYHRENCPL